MNINTRTIVSALVAASLGASSLAFAQPGRGEPPRDTRPAPHGPQQNMHAPPPPPRVQAPPPPPNVHRPQPPRPPEARHYYNARGAEFRRGQRLPQELRHNHYVVSNWKQHRLSAPPRGYHWVQVGPDFVLVAVATGIIANLVLGH